MTAQDVAALAQSGALVVGFLYLTWQLPHMWRDWLKMATAAREQQAAEREADRVSRHETASLFTRAVAETYQVHRQALEVLSNAITELRVASERICRYGRNEPNG